MEREEDRDKAPGRDRKRGKSRDEIRAGLRGKTEERDVRFVHAFCGIGAIFADERVFFRS